MDKSFSRLQEEIKYVFRDETLLRRALTHTSRANEERLGHLGSNERLEFLGDAVLELVSSEFFYRTYPELPEGDLTRMRAAFVCEPALAFCAETIELGSFLLLGKGEDQTGGRMRPSVVSDAMEAVIGAIYLDGGFACAKDFILRFILNDIEGKQHFYDAKTTLQEEAQKNGGGEITYRLISEEGPDHHKVFTCAVLQDGREIGTGRGSSKKNAEQTAAYQVLLERGKAKKDIGEQTCI